MAIILGELMARPCEFSQEVADEICGRLSEGESLREICRGEAFPAAGTVYRWLTKYPEFQEQYARARVVQADAIFEEILEIADNAQNDWMERNADENKGWEANGEHIQRSRLRIDARKWMAGKLRPKVYGDKVVNEHSGPDGGAIPISEVVFQVHDPARKED